MNRLLTILAAFGLIVVFAYSAHAACDVSKLHVVRSEGATGSFQIYDFAPPTVLPIYYFRFTTNDANIIDNLNSAWVGHLTVRVIGNAASCPTTGVIRNGGNITYLYRDSFF